MKYGGVWLASDTVRVPAVSFPCVTKRSTECTVGHYASRLLAAAVDDVGGQGIRGQKMPRHPG